MNLTRLALDKHIVTFVTLGVLVVAGLQAYRSMPRAEDPGFIIRTALIVTRFPGASPRRVEELVTDKIEKVVQQMPELDFVSSTSKAGVSLIYVNIKKSYRHMRPIWDDLRRKVDGMRDELPEGVVGPTVNDDFGDVFGTFLTVTGDGFDIAELKTVAEEMREDLLLLDEVGKVEIHGVQDERIFIEYTNARLAELGLSPGQLAQILETRNIVVPGGSVRTPDDRERIDLEPTGNFESLDDLRRTVVQLPGRSDLVYLEDIVEIHRGTVDPPAAIVRYRGEPALCIAINLRDGGNIIRLGEAVRTLVPEFEARYPIGVEMAFPAFQATHVQRKVRDFTSSLLQAIGIVLLVMLVSLGRRTGFVVATLIPVTMILSLLVMSAFGIGLDQMSLAALIIALGLLVDNAIVMSESILVAMRAGKKPVQAALESAAELRVPLLTSSLTTAAAFLPIYLAESDVGEYTAPLFKVVSIALLTSWVLALTMTPLLCVRFLRVPPAAGGGAPSQPGAASAAARTPTAPTGTSRFHRTYRRGLLAGLRHPWRALAGVVAAFALALFGFRFLPNIFFPPNDKAIFTVELELPLGTPIEYTDRVVAELENYMAGELLAGPERPRGVHDWVSFMGEGAPRFVLTYNPEPAKPNYAMLIVNATDLESMPALIARVRRYCDEQFPDAVAAVEPLGLGPTPDAPVEVRISARDEDRLFAIADQVARRMERMPGLRNVENNWGHRTKKLRVRVSQERARRAGLTNRDIALSLRTILDGIPTTEFREEDDVIPIVLRSVAADRDDLGKLASHQIYAQATGRSVPLEQVADLEVVWEPSQILRRNRVKTVTLQADVDDGRTTPIGAAQALGAWLDEVRASWGGGVRDELGGEMENSAEANASIAAKLPWAALVIVLLLVAQFNSVRRPLIVLATIPLGIIGVTFGLLVARSYFGFMTLLGIISLAGIVINNAIVLIERIEIERREPGADARRAILDAAVRRMRPILLTTATTIGGLLPLWLGGGPMWEPMAIAIIFGLLFATVLTLGVVPLLYALLFRVRFAGYAEAPGR